MSQKELMQRGLSMSMDDLQATIENYKYSLAILEQVKRLRMRDGELTTKQKKARAKKAQKQQTNTTE
jgi:hypothetical protein